MKKLQILSYLMIFLFAYSCSNYGTKLEFNGGELYYTQKVEKSDAEKLGKYLVDEQFYDGNPKTVQLDKKNDTFLFRMVTKDEFVDDLKTAQLMFAFATELSTNVFNGSPVVMHMCDKQLKTLKVFHMNKGSVAINDYGTKLIFNNGELYYTDNVTESDANKLGKFLVNEGFYNGNVISVQLDKDQEVWLFRMVTKADLVNEETTFITMKSIIQLVSRDVFNNEKVRAELTDEYFKTVRVVEM